jgi:multidrug transporter EmrE-like cation transporter
MARSTFSLILVSVLLSSVAQIVLKQGMSGMSAHWASSGSGFDGRALLQIATSPAVLGGLFIYFLSASVWLLVLARVPVGFAYPFVGLGFVMTMLLAWLIRGEVPSLAQILGTLTICAGVALMARA